MVGGNRLISIVVATRDRSEILAECLSLLFEQEYDAFEVIVVDNSSNEQSAYVVDAFAVKRYVRERPEEDNPAYLRNSGLRYADGEILVFIDDDCLVTPGWLQGIADAFLDPAIGGVTGRIIDQKYPVVNTPIIARLSPKGGIIRNINNVWPEPVEVDFLFGGNMAVARAAALQTGLFDPWMGYSREDQEWSLRIKRAGYRLVFWPRAVVHHLSAPRAAGVVQRESVADVRTRYYQVRAATYQSLVHFGLNRFFLKDMLVGYPKSDLMRLWRTRSLHHLLLPLGTASGMVAGSAMAAVARAGLHRPPTLDTQAEASLNLTPAAPGFQL